MSYNVALQSLLIQGASGLEKPSLLPILTGQLTPTLLYIGMEDTSTDEVIPSVTSYSKSPSPVVRVPTSSKPGPFSESKSTDLKDLDSQDLLEEKSEAYPVSFKTNFVYFRIVHLTT